MPNLTGDGVANVDTRRSAACILNDFEDMRDESGFDAYEVYSFLLRRFFFK